MKKITKQTFAVVLMVCMLVAMVPFGFVAEATTGEANVIEYAFDGTGFVAEGGSTNLPTDAEQELGAFTWLPSSNAGGKPKIVDDSETNTYNGAYLFHCTGWVTSDDTSTWIALKFNVAMAGEYTVTPSVPDASTNTANVFIVKFDSTETYDATYVANLNASDANGTLAAAFDMTFAEAGDYVMILKSNRTKGNHFRFYGMTLTGDPIIEPASVSYDFTDTAATNWTTIAARSTGTTGTFVNTDTLIAVQLNDTMGVGAYALKLDARQYTGDVREVYMIPVRAFDGAEIDKDLVEEYAVNEYLVGTVDCYSGGNDLDIIFEVKAQDSFVLALVNVGTREGNDHRASIVSMTMEPVSKVVNDTYYTVADALAAGVTNLQLTGDVTEDITLTGGATLDLNGKTVTGDVTIVNGQIVDNAGNGGIVGAVDATGNEAMAIYDGDTCRFFSYNVKTAYVAEGESGNAEFWFDIDFDNAAAYALLSNSENDAKVSVKATLSWTGDKSGSKEIVFNTVVADWAAADHAANDYGLCLQITNVPAGVTGITVTPEFVGSGATAGFAAISNN